MADTKLPDGWKYAEGSPAQHVTELSEKLFTLGTPEWLFRGASRAFPTGRSSLGRLIAKDGNPLRAECSEIEWFLHHAQPFMTSTERALIDDDIIGQLTLMQHYGGPTRLLDWTYSPWVAAYHASRHDLQLDGYVWGFSPATFGRSRHV